MAPARAVSVLFVAAAMSAVACGGGGSSAPTAPTQPARTPAQLTVTDVSAGAARATSGAAANMMTLATVGHFIGGAESPKATGIDYTVKFTVKETGGQTGATLGQVTLLFYVDNAGLGTSSPGSVFASTTLAAGGSSASRTLTINNPSTTDAAATRVEIRVAYTDQVSGSTGTATGGADIPAIPPPLVPPVVNEFASSPSIIDPGQSSTLRWNVTGATSVVIDPDLGQVSPTGTRVVSPVFSRFYTLTATNADGKTTKTASVIVSYPNVEYVVSGTTERISLITYTNATGGTAQVSKIIPPWSYRFSGASSGQFLYVSAQNDKATGCVTVKILKHGNTYKQTESCGAYVIATASGSF